MTTTATLDDAQRAARDAAFSMPLEEINPAYPPFFENDTIGHYFERLRRDAPEGQKLPMFIAMDPPKHDEQRKAVSPSWRRLNLSKMEDLIRERTCKVLDSLPRNETFDWVDKVSIELTTLMLATLFDFPVEDRRLLTLVVRRGHVQPIFNPKALARERMAELGKMLATSPGSGTSASTPRRAPTWCRCWRTAPATRNMTPMEYMGNLVLLIVGGNDTTRNSMTGGLLALHASPEQFAKLRANPALVDSLVPEIIRWQTPLAYMRRTAVQDTELGGKQIAKGDKVVMWYLSGNRDETAIENPDQFIIDRARPRQHLSFGFGIHRCVGNRLAEMQLKILWEEILQALPAHRGGRTNRSACPRRSCAATPACRSGSPAEAAGVGLALCGDTVITTASMKLRTGYAAIALSPDAGASYFLARRVGSERAKQLFFYSEPIDSARCLDLGIVDAVHADAEFTAATEALVSRLAAAATGSMARIKQLCEGIDARSLHDHLALERRLLQEASRQPDAAEGIRAFLEKRAPRFTGS
jgi:cytochrome P450